MRRLALWVLVVATCCLPFQLHAAQTVSIATLNCEFLSTKKAHKTFRLPFAEKDWTQRQKDTWRWRRIAGQSKCLVLLLN